MRDFLLLKGGPTFRLGSGLSEATEREMWDALFALLRANDLLAGGVALPSSSAASEGFSLRTTHLNERGFAVMQCGLDKWLRAIDRGRPPSDTSVLQKCLAKV